MGFSELSLPIDIPWKRLAVSGDMLDNQYDDGRFPAKWRSSIAAFYHEPRELNPAYCNRRITYLKIVCTITNYQIGGEDVTALDRLRGRFGQWAPIKEFDGRLTRAFPCHGALLQASVFPNPAENVPLHDFPYITSIQPRKRELYEVATQSGEIASQSANKLNVLKGTTTTGTTEDYDLELGGGSGGHSALFGLWSEQHSDPQKQAGTINRRQTQDQNVTTSDASRDRREQHAFSTSINQLHTLLQSYHLGTNRVMFFLQPAPHMQDMRFSFVRGSRRLEGIQEFFLIVNRPARVPGLCLEVALETAHPYVRTAYMPRLIALGDLFAPGNLAKTEMALGLLGDPQFNAYREFRDAWNGTWHDRRWAMNQASYFPADAQEALASEVTVKVPGIGVEDCALILEQYEAWNGKFFVSARRFCTCWTPKEAGDAHEPAPIAGAEPVEEECEESSPDNLSACAFDVRSIVFEGAIDADPAFRDASRQKAMSHNAAVHGLNEALFASLEASDRTPTGQRSFLHTEFAANEMAELLRQAGEAVAERPLHELAAFRRALEESGGSEELRRLGEESVHRLRVLSTADLARRLRMTMPAATRLHAELLTEALQTLEPARLPGMREPDAAYVDPREAAARAVESARGTARPPGQRPSPRRVPETE